MTGRCRVNPVGDNPTIRPQGTGTDASNATVGSLDDPATTPDASQADDSNSGGVADASVESTSTMDRLDAASTQLTSSNETSSLPSGTDASPDSGLDSASSSTSGLSDAGAVDLSQLNTECVNNACEDGLTAVHYFGIAGPSGPEFCTCTIPCAGDPAICPNGTECQTIADGPGEVCVASQAPANLRWFTTCGDPVCRVDSQPSDLPPCADLVSEGELCTDVGVQCDASLGCGAALICADSDPKQGPGGCPISRARYKHDIAYVHQGERRELARQLLQLPLVTYEYTTDEQSRRQLGVLNQGSVISPSFDVERGEVNLYGYTTMVVAALQEQQRELTALRSEVQALRDRQKPRASMQCTP